MSFWNPDPLPNTAEDIDAWAGQQQDDILAQLQAMMPGRKDFDLTTAEGRKAYGEAQKASIEAEMGALRTAQEDAFAAAQAEAGIKSAAANNEATKVKAAERAAQEATTAEESRLVDEREARAWAQHDLASKEFAAEMARREEERRAAKADYDRQEAERVYWRSPEGRARWDRSVESKGRSGVLGPILSVASILYPPLAPLAIAMNASNAAFNGDVLGTAAALINLPGVSAALPAQLVSTVRTVNQANNLYNAVESGNVLGAIGAGVGLTGTGGTQIGDTGYNVADALKTANIAKAAESGNIAPLLGYIGKQITDTGPNSADFEDGYFEPGGAGDVLQDYAVPTEEAQQSSVDDLLAELEPNEVTPPGDAATETLDRLESIPQDEMTPEDWVALYAVPTTDPTTGETIVGEDPTEYQNQDFGSSVGDISTDTEYYSAPPAAGGTENRIIQYDDGSSIEIDPDGTVVDVKEAPEGSVISDYVAQPAAPKPTPAAPAPVVPAPVVTTPEAPAPAEPAPKAGTPDKSGTDIASLLALLGGGRGGGQGVAQASQDNSADVQLMQDIFGSSLGFDAPKSKTAKAAHGGSVDELLQILRG